MKLELARELALQIVASMGPHCERVAIAGSIRRGKPDVKDIDILAVPRWKEGNPLTLFGDTEKLNSLLICAFDREAEGLVQWIKPGTSEVIPWEPRRDGKYWRGLLPQHDLKLDLFLVTPETWGMQFLIRTGSAEFSRAVVTHALRIGRPCRNGSLHETEGGPPIPTPEEEDVFRLLGLEWVDPEQRTGPEAVRGVRAGRPH